MHFAKYKILKIANSFILLLFNIVHKFITIIMSLWLQCLISVIYIMIGNAMELIQYQGVVLTLTFVAIVSAVLYLRWNKPKVHRPVQVSPSAL